MIKKELTNKVEYLKKEVLRFYNYDFEKFNKYCCKLYQGMLAWDSNSIKYNNAIRTSLEYLEGLTRGQIDTLCELYFYERLLRMINRGDRVFIDIYDSNYAHIIDTDDMTYRLTNWFDPRRFSDVSHDAIIRNTIEIQ